MMGLDEDAKPSKEIAEKIAQIKSYVQQSASLLLYQSVLTSHIGQTFLALLNALLQGEPVNCALAYGQWFSALATQQQSWQHHLIVQILQADNAFSRQAQRIPADAIAEKLPPGIWAAVRHDMNILQRLYDLPAEQLSQWVQQVCKGSAPPAANFIDELKLPVALLHQPDWPTDWPADWSKVPQALASYYYSNGVGIFGQFAAFRWQNGQLVGIASPDAIRLEQLAAYEHPKQQLIQNTEALLRHCTAQNVLLYGSRGAGKSSLVKALLNEYRGRGLRLIEVPKADLHHLPQIVEPLSQVPQKFIIFVDDLSFEEDDEAFKALKVVLEGGVTARPQNVVVYATSNRRHLVREFFDERPKPKDAEEIQAWDTVQEKLSFSDRFGLTLTFTPADQPTYLAIVRELAKQAGLSIDTEHLEWRARQWATRHNGRSGRTARQFIDFLIAEQDN
jgi:uncharacterized protein